MAGRNGENYGSKETAENKEQKQEFPERFEKSIN